MGSTYLILTLPDFMNLLSELPGVLRELGMQKGCSYDTFLDTFVAEHMKKGVDKDLSAAQRKMLKTEAQNKDMARERMKKKFRKENVPDDLSPLDRLLPYSPEVREQEKIYKEKKIRRISEHSSERPQPVPGQILPADISA